MRVAGFCSGCENTTVPGKFVLESGPEVRFLARYTLSLARCSIMHEDASMPGIVHFESI